MRTTSLAKLPFFLFLGRPLFLIGLKNDCILENPAASLSSSVRQPFFTGAMVAVAVPSEEEASGEVASEEEEASEEEASEEVAAVHRRQLRRLQY